MPTASIHPLVMLRQTLAALAIALATACTDTPVTQPIPMATPRANVGASTSPQLFLDRASFLGAVAGAPRVSTYDFTSPAPSFDADPELGQVIRVDDVRVLGASNYWNLFLVGAPNVAMRLVLPPGTVAVGFLMARFHDNTGDWEMRLPSGDVHRVFSGPAGPGQPAKFFGVRSDEPIEWIEFLHTGTLGILDDLVIAVDPSTLNRPPVAIAAAGSGVEGSPVAFDGTGSTDPNGDAIVSHTWTFGDGATGTGASPSHTYVESGTYAATLVVTDARGLASAVHAFQVVVANAAPVVTAVTLPTGPVQLGTSVTLAAAFTDAGAADTHTAWFGLGAGDAVTAGTVSSQGGAGSVSGTHTYAQPGVYTVTATVTDDEGEAGSRSSVLDLPAYVVVYDPSGSFVTGGGWIVSPANACSTATCANTGEGRASFGFVSKYAPGAHTPSGNTEFEFRTGGFRFRSTSYDWLVVGGSKAQYKGTGTVNGAGDYGFLLTATDGGASKDDGFRLKVWSKATGAVVYDNQSGAADDSDASTALGGGSIVIHRQ